MLNVTGNVAFPELSSGVGPPRTVAPSFSVTLPSVTLLGFMPSVRVTVAVNVTAAPTVDGLGFDVRAVDVPIFTVSCWIAEVSPVDAAVIVGVPSFVSLYKKLAV